MEKRTCPKCGTDWYSAETTRDWICGYCYTKIPKINNYDACEHQYVRGDEVACKRYDQGDDEK